MTRSLSHRRVATSSPGSGRSARNAAPANANVWRAGRGADLAATAITLSDKRFPANTVQNALAALRKNNQIIKDETRGGISPIFPTFRSAWLHSTSCPNIDLWLGGGRLGLRHWLLLHT